MLEDIYNYLKLSDTLASSGQPTEAQIADIAQAGYQVVINLALTDTDYALPDEKATVESHHMQYVHIPVIWIQPTRSNLEMFFSTLETHRGQKIFVHCAANMRVSTFIALYRIKRLGWLPEKAFSDMRRIWEPNEVWQAFIQEQLSES